MNNVETLVGSESTSSADARANLKVAFAAYKNLDVRRAELQSEIDALRAEQGELVEAMSDCLPNGTTSFTADGKKLIPVVGGGKGGNSNFLRGYSEPKARKATETLDLDSEV